MSEHPSVAIGDVLLPMRNRKADGYADSVVVTGYDAPTRMVRWEIPRMGVTGIGPSERYALAPRGWQDRPEPPMSAVDRLKNAVDGELYGEEFAEAVAQDGKPQHLRRQASYYMQMINWAAWHLSRINAVEAAQEIAQSKVELDALLLRMKGD